MPYTYDYPRPAVGVDLLILREDAGKQCLLLIQRRHEPFQDHWALPGGFMEIDETLETAAARELKEETGLDVVSLKQVGAFSTLDRDPRSRVITVAFLATVPPDQTAVAADDAKNADWFPVDELPPLAFDHPSIVRTGLAMR